MTDEVDIAPDPIVRTALQLLPVPEHGAPFWADLVARLGEEPAHQVDEPAFAVGPRVVPAAGRVLPAAASSITPVPPAAPVVTASGAAVPAAVARGSAVRQRQGAELEPDPALLLVPQSLRRRSNVVLSVVAVAAAAVVVVAGTALVRQRADGADAAEVAATGDALDDPSTSTSRLVAATSVAETTAPSEAVLSWVAAISTGDTERAWALLGPGSKAYFGSRSAFAAQESALAADVGAWSSATSDDALVMAVGAGGDGEVVVVTLVGAGAQKGAPPRVAAFPVRVVEGAVLLEPFAFAGELEVIVPEAGADDRSLAVVGRDDELVVVVPRGVDAPVIRLDDGAPLVCGDAAGTELTKLDSAPGQRCSYLPPKGIRPGRRILTVAFLSPDGSGIGAESVVFEAA